MTRPGRRPSGPPYLHSVYYMYWKQQWPPYRTPPSYKPTQFLSEGLPIRDTQTNKRQKCSEAQRKSDLIRESNTTIDTPPFFPTFVSSFLPSFLPSFFDISKFAYFPLFQGQAVPRCMSCLSDDSLEDCDNKAGDGVICPGEDPVCAMYIVTKELRGESNQRFMRFCTSSRQIEILQEMCGLGPLFIPGLGTTTCTAYEDSCSTDTCF